MDSLRKIHDLKISNQDINFSRYLINKLPWNDRLMGIKGFRGVGKTTLMLQYIKKNYNLSDEALYISLDNFYFLENSLIDLVDQFVSKGGKHLFIDEIHKYNNWAISLKNIYDTYSDLKIAFTGSSLLEILNSKVDLSRRALVFNMQGLSFREYLNFTLKTDLQSYTLNEIIENHKNIAIELTMSIKVLKYFSDYFKFGYFPFFYIDKEFYHQRIQEIISLTIDIEFPQLRKVDPLKTKKIKQLLFIISHSSPFKPNISKLASKINVTRNTLNEYIKILAEANLLNLLNKDAFGINLLQKPEKIFLENPNLAYTFAQNNPDIGNLRETFFLNQLSQKHTVTYPEKGDFLVNDKYLFEVGGKSKTQKQIAGISNAYIAADDIEFGNENKIPLWLFGFLY